MNKLKLCFFSKQNFLIDAGNGGNKLSRDLFHMFIDIFGKKNVSLVMVDTGKSLVNMGDNQEYSVSLTKAYHSTLFRNINYLFLRDEITGREKKKVIDVLKKVNADYYFFDGTWMGNFSKRLKGKKVIVFYHNIEKQLAYNRIKKDRGVVGIPRFLSNWNNEKNVTVNADVRICLNYRDAKLLVNYYGKDADIILPIFVSDPGEMEVRVMNRDIKLLFVGSYFYPNIQGIRWFCKEVMPRLNCKLYIVGKGMELLKDELANEQVEVCGFVDSLGEVYQEADIVVSPIFSGGGMKVKIAEALSYGKPILATREALEGYQYTEEHDVWECNSVEDFVRTFGNITSSTRMSYSIRNYKLFKEKYSREMAAQKLHEVFLKIEKNGFKN